MEDHYRSVRYARFLGLEVASFASERGFFESYSRNDRYMMKEYASSILRMAREATHIGGLGDYKSIPHLIAHMGGHDYDVAGNLEPLMLRRLASEVISNAVLYDSLLNTNGTSSRFYLKNFIYNRMSIDPLAYKPLDRPFSSLFSVLDLSSLKLNEDYDPMHHEFYLIQEFVEKYGKASFFRMPYELRVGNDAVELLYSPEEFHPHYYLHKNAITFIHRDIDLEIGPVGFDLGSENYYGLN